MKYKDRSIPKSLEEIEERGPINGALVVEHNALNAVSLKALQEVAENVDSYAKELSNLKITMELKFDLPQSK